MIFLTGSSGSIGAHIKADINLTLKFPASAQKINSSLAQSKNSTLFHLAALSSPKLVADNQDYAYQINVKSSLDLFRVFAENKGTRFVFASTGHVYGETLKDHFSSEMDQIDPRSAYAEQKAIAESLLISEAENSDTELLILRIFSVFGNGMRENYLSGMIEKSVNSLNVMPIISTSDDERDFSSPERVASYFQKSSQIKMDKILVLNICSGKSRTVREQVQSYYPQIPPENFLKGNSNIPRLVGSTSFLSQFFPPT